MHGRTGAGARTAGRVRPLSVRWRLPVDRLISLAPRLAGAVAEWHQRAGPHGGLCPEVIDLDEDGNVLVRPAGPVRTEYLAPEQLGRLRCGVDERCDLFALGVLLYQLATGQLPYAVAGLGPEPDPWTDPRLTGRVERPRQLVPQLPESFDEIVALLLAARPHERYQSARGLAADLERCQEQLRVAGRVEPFPLAGCDVAPRLRMSGRIHGRDRILARLGATVDRVRRTGQVEVVVVTAEAGLGKTAVVDAFADRITCSGGRVVGGRFAPGTVMSYAGIVTMIDDLGARLGPGHPHLREALGACAGTLGHLSSEVAAIVDPATMAAEATSPAAAERQARLAVRRLLAAAVDPARPLVVTLDDLHWADPASIGLLRELLSHPDIRHVLVMATCQAGLPPKHPVRSLLADLGRRVPVTTLPLRPLSDNALTEWVEDSLRARRADAAKLTRVLAAATGSLPLLAVQFLHRLADRGWLSFDPAGPRWRWRLDLADQPLTIDDVGSVVGARVLGMTSAGRRMLTAAAVLGPEVDRDLLARVADLPVEPATAALAEAVHIGFLVGAAGTSAGPPGAGGRFRWTSQRLRQILLDSVPTEEHRQLRHACGAALLSVTDQTGYAFFAIVDHLNAVGESASGEPARVDLVQLNLSAGRRAWRVGDAAAARHYLRAAVALIRAEDWTSHRPLAFAVYSWAARTEHCLGAIDDAERLLTAAAGQAVDNVDRAILLRVDVLAADRRGDHQAAHQSTLAALAWLEVDLPPHPATAETVDAFVRRVLRHLNSKPPQTLADAPPTYEARIQLAAQIAADTLSPFTAGSDHATLLAAIGVELCLTHGPTDTSSLAFACLAVSLAERFGDDTTAQRCLRTALRLLGDQPGPDLAVRVLPAMAFVPVVRLDGSDTVLERLQEAYLIAVELGDAETAEAVHILHGAHRFLAGAPLDGIAEQVARTEWSPGLDEAIRAAGHCLRDAVERLRTVPWTVDSAEKSVASAVRPGHLLALCTTVRLAAACVLGDHAQARSLADDLATAAGFIGADGCFYRALAIAMTWSALEVERHESDASTLDALQSTLDQWAARAPARYAHKALLISAERARIAGDDASAQRRFDLAIAAARHHDSVHIEAIAAERAAVHADHRGESAHVLAYLRRARACYQRWNARAKLDQLDADTSHAPAESGGDVDQLDLLALANELEALSAEHELDRVVDNTAELFLRHLGADRACLLLTDGDALRLGAVATSAGGRVRLSRPVNSAVSPHSQVPLTILGQVSDARRAFAVDLQTLPDLPRDPYLLRHRPRALLCAPLIRGERLLGLVYLEYQRQPPRPGSRHTLPLLCVHAATVLDDAHRAAELFEATQILTAAFERLPVGLILLGPDLTVRRASPHASQLTGLPIRPGTPIAEVFDVLAPADTPQSNYALELALAVAGPGRDEPLHQTITLIRPDGPRVTLHTHASALRRADRSLLGIALLISEANAANAANG